MEHVLITGVNGFIGSHLAEYYINKGCRVLGVDIASISVVNKIEYHRIDMTKNGIEEIIRDADIDLVIHCAGNASVPLSIQDPLNDYELNTTAVYRLMQSCLNKPALKVVHISSAGVYGNPKCMPVRESDDEMPISPYALNKSLAERICRFYRMNNGVNVINIRVFSAYGPGLKKQIFWDMFQKSKLTGRLDLFGTGDESRDFIFIDDLVRAIDIIAMKAERPLINVANGEEVTIRKVAELFAKIAGLSPDNIRFNKCTREGDPLNWRADVTYLRELGYQKSISLEEGIRRYYEWAASVQE